MPRPTKPTRLPDEQPETTYFGKRDGSMTDRYIWVWRFNRLDVAQGTDHGKDMGLDTAGLDKFYRGWFDPVNHEMFVVCPRRAANATAVIMHGIPRVLDRALQRRFGQRFDYKVF